MTKIPKIIVLIGPPGCGKSTFAINYLDNHNAKILSRDSFRDHMQLGEYGAKDEKVIKSIRNYAVESWLNFGYDVIIDDLNLTPDVFPMMVEIANRVGDVDVEEHIIQVTRETCRKQNLARAHPVPEKDWIKWWLKYTEHDKHDTYCAPPRAAGLQTYYDEYDKTDLPLAIIVDLDETIAMHPFDRDPFDHTQIPKDFPNLPLLDLMDMYGAQGTSVILVTGRNEISEESTRDWLMEHNAWFDALYMRPVDQEEVSDIIIKKEIYEKHIKDNYFVVGVFEDRERTTAAWRSLGLPVYQVQFGRY